MLHNSFSLDFLDIVGANIGTLKLAANGKDWCNINFSTLLFLLNPGSQYGLPSLIFSYPTLLTEERKSHMK